MGSNQRKQSINKYDLVNRIGFEWKGNIRVCKAAHLSSCSKMLRERRRLLKTLGVGGAGTYWIALVGTELIHCVHLLASNLWRSACFCLECWDYRQAIYHAQLNKMTFQIKDKKTYNNWHLKTINEPTINPLLSNWGPGTWIKCRNIFLKMK